MDMAVSVPLLKFITSLSKVIRFNRCLSKIVDREYGKLQPLTTPTPTQYFPPELLSWLNDWLAPIRILNERTFLLSQAVSESSSEMGFGLEEQPSLRL